MSRDLKLGMLAGLVVVVIALVVISMWPGGTVEERLRQGHGRSVQEPQARPSVVIPAGPPAEPPPPTPEDVTRAAIQVVEETRQTPVDTSPRIHVVAKDENLSTIAQVHYGDANKWPLIAEANKNVLPDVNRVRPGLRLVIPLPTED